MDENKKRLIVWSFVNVLIVLASGFLIGIMGMQFVKGHQILGKEKNSKHLITGMERVSVEQEIYFDSKSAIGEAQITNPIDNDMLVTASIWLDRDGTLLYQSDIIEPGHYIERIQLLMELGPGSYAGTVIWKFYQLESEAFIGETADKIIIIMKN